MASATIAELVTKYTLDDGQYVAATKRVVGATHQIADAAQNAGASILDSFGSVAKSVLSLAAPLAAIASVAGVVDLGKQALDAASKFDVLERKLTAVTGSLQRAKDVMSFSEGQAGIYGIFSPEQLDATAAKIEGFGMKTERILPIIEMLAAVMGTGADAIDEYAIALGRIAEGSPGRAMMILAGAGISRQDLQAHGVQFKGGANGAQMMPSSSPGVVMSAVEAVVTQKFGALGGQMQGSDASVARRLGDAWDQALRQIGDVLKTAVLPVMDHVAKIISDWTASGKLSKVVDSFLTLFGLGSGSNIEGTLDHIAAVVAGLPDKVTAISTALRQKFGDALHYVLDLISRMGAAMAGIWAFGAMIKGWEAIAAAVKLVNAQQTIGLAISAALAVMLGQAGRVAVALGVGAAVAAGTYYGSKWLISREFPRSNAGADAIGTATTPSKPDDGALGALQKHLADIGSIARDAEERQYLKEIAANTKAAVVDLRRYALGGGEMGAIGLERVETGRAAGRMSRRGGDSSIEGHIRALVDAISAEFERGQGHHARQGWASG